MLRAVLFDLDDTLFDHDACARAALHGVYRAHEAFASVPFAELAHVHAGALETLHARVVAGDVSMDEARIERFRRLFEFAGREVETAICVTAARQYREAYVAGRRAIAGASTLLAALHDRVRLGVVSNNVLAEQQEKMRVCGIDRYVHALIVSEEAGTAKPDPAIFRMALDRLACDPQDAVMIGDSWTSDVLGAAAAGIAPIWFNRRRLPLPATQPRIRQLHALEPVEDALEVIFQTDSLADAHRR